MAKRESAGQGTFEGGDRRVECLPEKGSFGLGQPTNSGGCLLLGGSPQRKAPMTQPQTPARVPSRTPSIAVVLVAATALVLAVVVSPLWLIIVVLFTVVNVIRLSRALGSSPTNPVVAAFLSTINLLIIGIVTLFYLSQRLGPLWSRSR